ncbi:pentapeptide repeat-containing protein [Paraoerskovia marina]|uniref:pentapeptide repeat-containing protein n=1 Tax=Paraoerskovia marina TaxID=545619 RepID=UPI00049255DE|nr:pentapeptide repeat-containing protein [Paraoerskovia marina]
MGRVGGALRWFRDNDWTRDLTIGALLALFGLWLAATIEDRVAQRQEVAENTRWVRELSVRDITDPSLVGIDLAGAELSGLDMACGDDSEVGDDGARAANERCWDLRLVDFSGASMAGVDLAGADLRGATFVGSVLAGAELANAVGPTYSDMRDAVLVGATLDVSGLDLVDLRGADLSEADLRGTPGGSTCWDESTTWPSGADPGAVAAGACDAVAQALRISEQDLGLLLEPLDDSD